ncbi:MAG: hypothetical protein JXR64_01610 [Spirochaetales bacterium]|nr:hypothetical protein [Spirochaetales bacterium]
MRKYFKFTVLILIFASCSTNKVDDKSFTFTSPNLPGFSISGIVANEEGIDYLYITSVRMFSNWAGGWTEGFFEASGRYQLEKSGNNYKLTEIDPFELWDIVSGEIRYHDNYYRGDDGVWKVKNRVDRLKELCRVLTIDMGFNKYSGNLEKEIYPTLFPELYKFKKLEVKGLLPKSYYESGLEPKTVRANDIKWRVDYTQAVFPQEFWELRDSGTLYRDVLEAPDIFNSLYNLEEFFSRKEINL